MISSNSSKEEVANFFVEKFKINEKEKQNLINEDICGDVLLDLEDKDFKSLKIRTGPNTKIKTFLRENQDKFKEKTISEKITSKSSKEEVANFFGRCLNYKGELNLDGKSLIELNEEKIEKLGLNMGQKKRIIKYIKYFRTLKIEEPEITEIILTRESSEEEVAKYLKKKLNFRDDAIDALALDGDSLFSLEEKDIDDADELKQEEKDKLKKLIKELKNEGTQEETEIILTRESSEEEVAKYLKKKLNFRDDAIDALALDGDSLFSLGEKDIDDADELKPEEKDNLKKLLNDLKQNNLKENNLKENTQEYNKIIDQRKTDKNPPESKSPKNLNNEKLNIKLENEKNDGLNKKEKDKKNNDKEEKKIKDNIVDKKENKKVDKNDDTNTINENQKPKKKNGLLNDKFENINKKYEISNIEYNENKSEIIKYNLIKECKIYTLIMNSNYNIFFFLPLYSKAINEISFSTFHKCNKFSNSFIIHNFFFINENIYQNADNKNITLLLVQIPLNKFIKELSIIVKIKDKIYRTEIEIYKETKNYFYIDNINNSFTIPINILFKSVIDFFFDKDNKKEVFQKYLVKALISIISKKIIILSPEIILRFFKYCIQFKLEPKKIDHITLIKEEKKNKKTLNEELCFSIDEMITLTNYKEKEKIKKLIILIYTIYDKKRLLKLIKSQKADEFSRIILDLLNGKELRFDDLSFENQGDRNVIQKSLLKTSQSKDEINNVIKISGGLTNSLRFIKDCWNEICNTLEQNKGYFSFLFSNKTLYLLSLENQQLNDKDNIKDIFDLLSKVIKLTEETKYNIISFEEIFKLLINFYSNKSLDDLCKLEMFVSLQKKLNNENIEYFYNVIHKKGMELIKNKKLKVEEIINFMKKKDYYYKEERFIDNKNRDPTIFKYIPITDDDKDYSTNIKLIKQNKLWELFSSKYLKENFYEVILEQMKKIRDFKSIFEIFPRESIKYDFIIKINEKFTNIFNKILDEKEENYDLIYKIIDNLLSLNITNGEIDETESIIKLIQKENSDFASKYFISLLGSKNSGIINSEIKQLIIDFFIQQNKQNWQIKTKDESLITLLLMSPDNDFSLSLLNQMDEMIAKDEDFYQKEETKNFLLFKLFFKKCGQLIDNKDINRGKYLDESVKLKNKILDDLNNSKIKYSLANNLIDESNLFYQKIFVIYDENENEAKKIYNKIKKNLKICKKKFENYEKIEDFYSTFYNSSKNKIIRLIKERLNDLKQQYIKDLMNLEECNFIMDNEFNYEKSFKETKNLKYKNSCFFMSIYRKKYDSEILKKSEDEIFKDSIDDYKETLTKIIEHKESGEPFFQINNINEIMSVIQNNKNKIEEEIIFIKEEFDFLGKEDYINNDLLNDLIIYSLKDKIIKLLKGIIYFIDLYKQINEIKITEFMDNLEKILFSIESNEVSCEEIKNTIDFLMNYDYDIKKETSLMKFYELLLGKKEAILFIKKIKDSNLEIRNLNEFIDENDNSQLQTTDIDHLIDIYIFFKELMNNNKIKTDEDFLKNFKTEFDNNNREIAIKLHRYLNIYTEIIQIYQSYNENPEMTIEKIENILKDSKVEIKKDNTDIFIYNIIYKNINGKLVSFNINELEGLRNKILMSSTKINNGKNEEGIKDDKKTKKNLTVEFLNLMGNIKHLTKTLNSLYKSGYPNTSNCTLKIINSEAYEENYEDDEDKPKRTLQKVVDDYNDDKIKFKNSVKTGYETSALLRLFYGKQLIKLHEKEIDKTTDISHLISSVSLNKIKETNVEFQYVFNLDYINNINKYLRKLFKINGVNLEDIYNNNKVKEGTGLLPGLYRKVKSNNYSDLIKEVLNIYLNMTGNAPIYNTLLICNEETNIELIRAFLYRALYCDKPILFLITNMECLELSIIQYFISILKNLYKAKNKNINSYLVFMYEKVDSGLVRDIERLIPEKNILNNNFLYNPKINYEDFEKVELYSSKYSGYGKTTEIIHKVKQLGGEYHYLPVGGSFSRKYLIKNLENLHLNLKDAKTTYLHLDLSETDNDDLMNEVLFKLLILRYIDTYEKIFYLGFDIHLIIEIPNGFIEFDKKYALLQLFKRINIDKLKPLRLEENIEFIRDSPISIVSEVLFLYDSNEIGTKNIDLDSKIKKNAEQCEKIINKYFKVENQSYYQKMNFIKILSVQFRKFTNNIYFDYGLAKSNGIGDLMKNARKMVIKNFIDLTTVFTRSPFDTVLLKKNKPRFLFGKYDEDQAREDAFESLANEKQEIFSFKQIEPSLVFFNQDGNSISIISNNDKNSNEYNNLKALWNSQNNDKQKNLELIDYKNMKHEAFLEQIKIVFALDNISIEQLKQLCEKLGNYIFVADNFIKMVRILLNIEAKIPVILMGETGVGKTKLLEMLITLYGKGTVKMEKLQIHAGINDQKIVDFIEDVNKQVKKEGRENEITWIFFDEINTCNSLGLITEIMCNHTYLGKKISDNFVFLGACNPYRMLTKKMRESGLVYYNMKEKNKLNNLVYTVNPLPHALLNFVFDFASLRPEDELKYITNTIISIIMSILGKNERDKKEEKKKIDKEEKEERQKVKKKGKNKKRKEREEVIDNRKELNLKEIIQEIIESIKICHDFIREKYDKSSVSLREIRRFRIFFEYFLNYFKKKKINNSLEENMKASLNLTLYLCYYLRLNDKQYRKELADKLKKFYPSSNFIIIPEEEIKFITNQMSIEEGKGIALNRALRENLFTCFICIDNNVPLIIVGKPGTGKSLSFQILSDSLKGNISESDLFKDKGRLFRFYYQGSETSTAEGIEKVFLRAQNEQKKNKGERIILVFFDEMGLAERSNNNPLKVIHYLLERDREDSVPFLGISNWKLDAAKINRALSLTITDYDIEDLEETAFSIAKAIDVNLSDKYKDFFKTLAITYFNYIKSTQNSIKENKDFHGNRDFYGLIKTAARKLKEKNDELIKNERRVLTENAIFCLNRNFGGLEDSSSKIKKIFKDQYHKFDENVDIDGKFSILEVIKTNNILNINNRYLMLISEGNDGSEIIKYCLNIIGKKYIELVGSKYNADLKSGKYSEEILNKIKYIMETDNVLILRDLDMIYPSLYDLFNQNFTCWGEKRFARIAFESAKILSEVNPDFYVIVIVNHNQIKNFKLDPPFLNRFEKHIVNFKMLLEEKDIEIATKISDFFYLISSFNNEEKLKIDLEKLLINSKQHNIEGLIYKIKNEKNNDNLINEQNYEMFMIKEVFKKIVPTFCQDIIASMMSIKLDQKYKAMNDLIIEIYKESRYNNFESFFKKIESKKNIIYTFSKTTEELFIEENSIENKYGIFNKNNTSIENIQSIKKESDLIFILKNFINKENQKILIIHFSENELNKVYSTNYLINNFEKENPKLNDKLIMFIIHKQRQLKEEIKNKGIIPDLIPFINDDYYQIFIDNIQGREDSDVFKILQKNNENLAKEYIEKSNFIENKIFTVLNYMKYKILYETKSLNLRNYTTEIAEKIIKNDKIKELIQSNIKEQGKSIKGIIKDIFTSDIVEVNDVDFFDVINSRLRSYFCLYLLNIILFSLKENVLNQILNTSHFDLLMQIDFFKNIINSTFEKTKFNFRPPIKMNINANLITIYNGLEIPKSKSYLDKLIKYVNNEISLRYSENEGSLRKNYSKEEKVEKITELYNYKMNRFEENTKIEMNKHELFKMIYFQNNDELKNLMLEEYLKYFVIQYLEKKEVDYKINENIVNFLKLILKVKLSENNNHNYDFDNTKEEFIKIVLFTQGYKEDIKNLFDSFIEVQKYCQNIEEYMISILKEGKIQIEISDRNKKYTKIVNIAFFNIIESLLRGILLYSIELIKKDKVKFFEFFNSFTFIEANLQKINKKFYLYSKEIYNIRTIIKIEEEYKYNHEQFEENYEKIMNNLLQQSILLYDNNYNDNLYNSILELNEIFEQTFINKTEEYKNLLFYIFRQQYRNIYDDKIRIRLIENFFNNQLLIRKSKIFLYESLKDLKPEVYNEKNKNHETQDSFVKHFMNLKDNKNLIKYENLIKIYNKINSKEFNELLLFFLEGQCQSYFNSILIKYNNNNNIGNKYSEECYNELLLNTSIEYLKIAIQYLYDHQNNNDNNLLKLYAIAYIKTYCYYYVDINYDDQNRFNYDEINKIFNENEGNKAKISEIINIYILRLYLKKFENYELFINAKLNIFQNSLHKKLIDERDKASNVKYIFKESLISPKYFKNYKSILTEIEDYLKKENNEGKNLDFEAINCNLDSFYCILVNKYLSYLYSNEKNNTIQQLKQIYEVSSKGIILCDEGKTLYKYLLEEDLLKNKIVQKISDAPLNQKDFEILLYSFRFIFNTINNKKCFYNNLLRSDAFNFINNNFIPGSFPILNEFVQSYNDLFQELPKRIELGYYVCKDCGYLYTIPPCTFPMNEGKCPKGHKIGGLHHVCSKMDIRVFLDEKSYEDFIKKWNYKDHKSWHDSFIHKTLDEYKTEYVDEYLLKKEKGIIKDFRYNDFESNRPVRELNIISYRIMNFILYSYLMGSFILDNLKEGEMRNLLVENLFPHTLFGIIKKGWELLDKSLKEIGIENVQIFINMIFDKVIELMNNLELVQTQDQFDEFEKAVDNYIKDIIKNQDNIKKLNEDYQKLNDELLNFDPYSMKEIIQGNYDPSIYQDIYPDIQYYTVSNIQNFDTFINKFKSSEDNKKKYALINLLINKDAELTKDAINVKSLLDINNLENLLLKIYSYKISREDGKSKKLNEELEYIKDKYNEMNPTIVIDDEEALKEKFIIPFINSWDKIKSKSIQYKCRNLKNPLDITLEKNLCYFLVDDGDQDGGMFLASAYEHLIKWQNLFINEIITKNSMRGILNSYISQLEQEINIEDATIREIININDNTYKRLNELISSSSMRNIFRENDKINYKNYNDIQYNFDFIEEEMGKLILPYLKKFKDDIKFIIYFGEEFRGGNSDILIKYNEKYIQRELTEDEKESLNELLKARNNSKFHKEVFSSLQILMNEIIKENYDQNHLIYQIIKSLPNYIIFNDELIKLFRNKYENNPNEKIFTINSLVSIIEFFEALCWKEMQNKITHDYHTTDLPEEIKNNIIDYFEKLTEDKIINKKIFTTALRRLISRSLVGSRQEIDIKSDSALKLYIDRPDLWNKKIIDNDLFYAEIEEIKQIFKEEIKISHCLELYKLLDGDHILNEIINIKDKDNQKGKENLNIIFNQNGEGNNDGVGKEEESDEESKDEDF